ncbi:hypothetical protein GCM10009610_05820 [Pseudonocardia xinjiangensis]
MAHQAFGDEPAREPGGSPDDEVEVGLTGRTGSNHAEETSSRRGRESVSASVGRARNGRLAGPERATRGSGTGDSRARSGRLAGPKRATRG